MNPIPCLTLRVLRPRDTLKRYSIHRHTNTMGNNITLRIKEHFVAFSELHLNINTGKQVFLHLYECPTGVVVHSTSVIIKVFFSRVTAFLY